MVHSSAHKSIFVPFDGTSLEGGKLVTLAEAHTVQTATRIGPSR